MSRMTETITLQAPKLKNKEHYHSKPQQCPHCGGRGHFCPEGPNDEAPKCERCAGTGWLQAIVDIAWVPTDRPTDRWHQGFDGSAKGINRAPGYLSADLKADAPRVKQYAHGAQRTDWEMDEQTRLKILRR